MFGSPVFGGRQKCRVVKWKVSVVILQNGQSSPLNAARHKRQKKISRVYITDDLYRIRVNNNLGPTNSSSLNLLLFFHLVLGDDIARYTN